MLRRPRVAKSSEQDSPVGIKRVPARLCKVIIIVPRQLLPHGFPICLFHLRLLLQDGQLLAQTLDLLSFLGLDSALLLSPRRHAVSH